MMPLVSLRLIGVAALLTMLALAGTVLLWRRWGRWRLVTRPVGILVFQVLLLLTVGLIVNRAEKFYPSWEALRGTEEGETVAAPPLPDGLLDPWLRQQARPDGSAVATWEPAAAKGWKLGGAATLTVPAGYLDRTSTVYPAVLALVPAGTSATTTGEVARTVTAAAGPAVVLSAPVGPDTRAGDLATALPAELGHDVRVTPRNWALVAPLADARRAVDTVAAAPGRFSALVLIGTGPGATVPAGVRLPAAIPVTVVRPDPAARATGTPPLNRTTPSKAAQRSPAPAEPKASTPKNQPAPSAAAVTAVPLPCAAGEEWRTALGWAVAQTPAALDQPIVLPSLSPTTPAPSGGPK
jgi:hypothetical protein